VPYTYLTLIGLTAVGIAVGGANVSEVTTSTCRENSPGISLSLHEGVSFLY
jgi:hypothetical protein